MPNAENTENKDGTTVDVKKDETTNKQVVNDAQLKPEELQKEFKIEEGKTFTSKEAMEILNNGIKKGHVIAKNQLNNDITKYKNEVSTLKTEKETLNTQLIDLNKKTETTVAEKAKDSKEKTEIELQLEDTNKRLKVMEDKAVEAVTEVTKLRDDSKADKLENRRLELIAKAKGRIVENSVKGNTVEELEASAKKATTEYDKIETEMKARFNVPESVDEDDNKEKKEVVVKRINPQDRDQTKDWKKSSDDIKKQIYAEAGFPVP